MIESGLVPSGTDPDSPEFFAAYQHLIYEFYLEQAAEILELPKEELRDIAMLYGPKLFSHVERAGEDALIAANGVVAGDSFGNGHFLTSGGAMTGIIGHGSRVLRYWQSRDAGATPPDAIRELADGIKEDTAAWLRVSAQEYHQAAPINFGAERIRQINEANDIGADAHASSIDAARRQRDGEPDRRIGQQRSQGNREDAAAPSTPNPNAVEADLFVRPARTERCGCVARACPPCPRTVGAAYPAKGTCTLSALMVYGALTAAVPGIGAAGVLVRQRVDVLMRALGRGGHDVASDGPGSQGIVRVDDADGDAGVALDVAGLLMGHDGVDQDVLAVGVHPGLADLRGTESVFFQGVEDAGHGVLVDAQSLVRLVHVVQRPAQLGLD